MCNDPLVTCTGHTIGEINHEYDVGRRYQEMDGQAKGGFGGGDYSRKDFDLGGFPLSPPQRLRSGWMKLSEGWKTHCALSP
jgi:hypothetical protein